MGLFLDMTLWDSTSNSFSVFFRVITCRLYQFIYTRVLTIVANDYYAEPFKHRAQHDNDVKKTERA